MSGKHSKPAQTRNMLAGDDDRLDEALEETFPASDPIAVAPIDGPNPSPPKQAPQKSDKV